MSELTVKIFKYAITLAVVTTLASGSLAYTYSATKEKIEAMKLEEQINAVKEVCSKAAKEGEILKDDEALKKASREVEIVKGVFKVEKNGKVSAYAIMVSPRGYGGPMTLMVGIDSDGEVTGVKVLEQKETPGLGDKVTGSKQFLSQFIGKSPEDPVEIKKDIEAVSGATISSKGVTTGIKEALKAFSIISPGEGND